METVKTELIEKPDLDHLTRFIKANGNRIQLDKSYSELSGREALRRMTQQAQNIVIDWRIMGRTEREIQDAVFDYLMGPTEEPISERK